MFDMADPNTSADAENKPSAVPIKDEIVYQTIIFNRDQDKDMILSALEIVKLFIIKKKRILVGGMSIDFALRKKGKQLYPDNTLPDYDFFSPEFHSDAYSIANELSKAGLTGISVINAFHASTMRVRVRFHVVADCTYIPNNLDAGIPTIAYESFRVIHPHYQMLNQHLALCQPYSGAPLETISRWKKDMSRFDILDKEYPVENKYELENMNFGELKEWNINIKDVCDLCLNGFGAVMYWFMLAKREGFSEADCVANEWGEFKKMGDISISESTVKLTIPVAKLDGSGNIGLSWLCDRREILKHPYVENIVKGRNGKDGKSVRQFNAFLDMLPRRYMISGEDGDRELVDNRGSMIGAHKDKIWIINPQGLLKYFLLNYIVSFNILKQRSGYCFYIAYRLAYSITKWAALRYKKSADVQMLKYLPSHITYGAHNWHETYILHRRIFQSTVGKIPREIARLDMPKPAFIDSAKDYPIEAAKFIFDPAASPIYQFDYRECQTPFTHAVLYDQKIDNEP